jgi:hypothetical protein
MTIMLVVALIIAAALMGPIGIGLGGSGVISAALMLGAWWLLYLRQPVPPPLGPDGVGVPPGLPGYADPGFAGAAAWSRGWDLSQRVREGSYESAGYSPYTRLPDAYVPEAESEKISGSIDLEKGSTFPQTTAAAVPQPPSWDPLGAAPFAWDLAAPADPPGPPVITAPLVRSPYTSIVIGLAVLAAGGAGTAAALGMEWMTPARIGAVALAVVGLGLVLGAFLRRGYGLLVVMAPLTAFVWLATMVGPVSLRPDTMGQHDWAAADSADLQPEYIVGMGAGKLDLRGMNLTASRTIHVTVRAGNFELFLPSGMNARGQCSATFGDTNCDQLSRMTNDGPVLTVNIDVRAGSAEVHRG